MSTPPKSDVSFMAGATAVRVGDDPFGRAEPTVWYQHPQWGLCYCWRRLLTQADRAALGLA